MADLLCAVDSPPGSVLNTLADLALPVKTVLAHVDVVGRVFMTYRTVGLRVVPVGSSSVLQRGHRFEVRGVNAVSGRTPFFDVIELETFLDRTDQQFPDQSMAEGTLPFPVREGVAIFADWMPEPAPVIADSDFLLQAFGKVFD